jgi:GT2 family glycosyltransferase
MAEMTTEGIVPKWNVLILNDDVVCPPNLVERLSERMRATNAVLAYPDQFGGTEEILHEKADPVPMDRRITGYAYMLRGENRTRLDERFGWWYGDDDLDWRCRQLGGSLLVPGCAVEHKFPNALTNANPDLQKQTAIDRQTFIDKWGRAPH